MNREKLIIANAIIEYGRLKNNNFKETYIPLSEDEIEKIFNTDGILRGMVLSTMESINRKQEILKEKIKTRVEELEKEQIGLNDLRKITYINMKMSENEKLLEEINKLKEGE